MSINIFWFRRDLRLNDNAGLYHALKSGKPVLPIFIFDKNILDTLEDRDDARITFLHDTLTELKTELEAKGSTLHVFYGTPEIVWKALTEKYTLDTVFTNKDYEPYALKRDGALKTFFQSQNIDFQLFKDHIIFENDEVTKDDGLPYTVFTPYSKKWKMKLDSHVEEHEDKNISFFLKPYPTENYFSNFITQAQLLSESEIRNRKSEIESPPPQYSNA